MFMDIRGRLGVQLCELEWSSELGTSQINGLIGIRTTGLDNDGVLKELDLVFRSRNCPGKRLGYSIITWLGNISILQSTPFFLLQLAFLRPTL